MSGQVAIEQGRHPWLPSRDAEEVLVLHRYDMPLIGVIRQDGDLYLYRCIEGQTEASHLWAYSALGEDELVTLSEASPEGLDQAVEPPQPPGRSSLPWPMTTPASQLLRLSPLPNATRALSTPQARPARRF